MTKGAGKKQHPFRLAAFMLTGAAFRALFAPAIQGPAIQLERQFIEHMLRIVCGAIAGAHWNYRYEFGSAIGLPCQSPRMKGMSDEQKKRSRNGSAGP